MKKTIRRVLLSALLAAALAPAASAHCPIYYILTGPGGLYWQISLAGNHFDGMLPGGVPGSLGPITTWTEHHLVSADSGIAVIGQVFTDAAGHFALCPPVSFDISGPPGCSDHGGVSGVVPHPSCIPSFTVVQTPSGALSCTSACLGGSFPVPQRYTPSSSAPPVLGSLSPSQAAPSSGPLAVTVSGSGFAAGAIVRWNGTPLPTFLLGGGSLAALVPDALLASPGTASVTVAIPGSVSGSLPFTVTP